MVKANTIGMIEKYDYAENGTAGEDLKTGALVALVSGEFKKSTTPTHIVGEFVDGEDCYTDFTVKKGTQFDFYKLGAWVGKELVVSPANITYSASQNYASITANTTLMGASTDGNFATITTAPTATGSFYFKVTKKVAFNGNGVKVEIKRA